MQIELADADLLYEATFPQLQFIVSSQSKTWQELQQLSGADDFDSFNGAVYCVDGTTRVAIKRYRGEPLNYYTLYTREDIDSALSLAIMEILGVPQSAVIWSRTEATEGSATRQLRTHP
ncbi:hypothetical protein E3C22_14960 [Jiella endophytica]|uniref:Uncharacterized protein n=1 Tax=Jiella endophytica TaxID=2558362 RepID=A0A4Y8RGS5_9HYPH|nr:hypothetical protein [Jiella endophytica]TFF21952.1 hypothetical protein E3C22_14960 [Jiella endophytica]